jgi:hypothetical protein
MTAQVFCRFMRVGNALYPEDHLLIELYILCYAKLITALASLASTQCIFNSQIEASRPSRLYRTTR